jgi:hypothetical protein
MLSYTADIIFPQQNARLQNIFEKIKGILNSFDGSIIFVIYRTSIGNLICIYESAVACVPQD